MKKNRIMVTAMIVAVLFVKLFMTGGLLRGLSGIDTPSLMLRGALAETPKTRLATVPIKDVLEDPLLQERALMKVLERKSQELDSRESRLLAEEQRIQVLKREIVEKIDALQGLEDRLGTMMDEEKTSESKKYKDLARVYDSAPPEKIASMIEQMDVKTAAGITMNMKRDKAGAVLWYLSPQKAVEITRQITRSSAAERPRP